MCLETLEDFRIKSNIGYQVVAEKDGEYHSLYYHPGVKRQRKEIGVWIHSSMLREITSVDFRPYRAGFHIFTKKEDADIFRNKWWFSGKVVRVEFSDVLAQGYQDGMKIIVAHKLKILEECV